MSDENLKGQYKNEKFVFIYSPSRPLKLVKHIYLGHIMKVDTDQSLKKQQHKSIKTCSNDSLHGIAGSEVRVRN